MSRPSLRHNFVLDSYSMPVQRSHPYQIRIEANGDTIDAYLDSVKRLTITDTACATGHLGVILVQATATYDDLEAWALPKIAEQGGWNGTEEGAPTSQRSRWIPPTEVGIQRSFPLCQVK